MSQYGIVIQELDADLLEGMASIEYTRKEKDGSVVSYHMIETNKDMTNENAMMFGSMEELNEWGVEHGTIKRTAIT